VNGTRIMVLMRLFGSVRGRAAEILSFCWQEREVEADASFILLAERLACYEFVDLRLE